MSSLELISYLGHLTELSPRPRLDLWFSYPRSVPSCQSTQAYESIETISKLNILIAQALLHSAFFVRWASVLFRVNEVQFKLPTTAQQDEMKEQLFKKTENPL